MNERTDHLPPQERVKKGIAWQEKVLSIMRENNFPTLMGEGWKLEASSDYEDKVEKTDCWLVRPDGSKLRGTCKKRESGKDILVDIYEPFYGVGKTANKKGRDFIYDYDFYVCLVNSTIYVTSGKELKSVIDKMLSEVTDSTIFPFTSKHFPTCQLRRHTDKYNGCPKLLAFVDPQVIEGKLIFSL